MKYMIFLLTALAFLNVHAVVQKESEDSLNSDLNYKMSTKPNDQRALASESEQDMDFQEEEEADRDVANDLETPSDTIQYWKY